MSGRAPASVATPTACGLRCTASGTNCQSYNPFAFGVALGAIVHRSPALRVHAVHGEGGEPHAERPCRSASRVHHARGRVAVSPQKSGGVGVTSARTGWSSGLGRKISSDVARRLFASLDSAMAPMGSTVAMTS